MIRPQNPFSLYDFLGYFIPGALGIYFLIFIYFHVDNGAFDKALFKQVFSVFNTHTYLPFVLVSYISGHFLSYLSSITIEKYSVWQHLYPSKYMLDITSKGYFYAKVALKRRSIGRVMNFLFILPVSFCDQIFGRFLNLRGLYLKSVDSVLQEILRNTVITISSKAKPTTIDDYNTWLSEDNFFRLCYHYALEHSSTHATKMQNYVALFGFTRTKTLIFSIVSWTFLIHLIIAYFSNQSTISIYNILYLFCASTFIAYTFYLAYNKFFRRFSLEAMLAATVTLNFPVRGFDQSSSQQIL